MMTSHIRSLLMQLSEAFEMFSNRLLEEEEGLSHAIEQLQGEVESIGSLVQRMESEEISLCNTEKASLTKEKAVAKNEDDLIEQRGAVSGGKEVREVRDVFEWIKSKIDQDIRQNDRWMDHSRKTRKTNEAVS